MVADVVGGRFVQHVPIDVVVDLRKRKMEHGERVILAVSLRVREYGDCDVFALLSPGALDESVLDLTEYASASKNHMCFVLSVQYW